MRTPSKTGLLFWLTISIGLLCGLVVLLRKWNVEASGKAVNRYEVTGQEIPDYVASALITLEDATLRYLSGPIRSQQKANRYASERLQDPRIWEARVDNGEQEGFTPISRLGNYNIIDGNVVSLKMEENAKFVGRTLKFDTKPWGPPNVKVYAYHRFIIIQKKVFMLEVYAQD